MSSAELAGRLAELTRPGGPIDFGPDRHRLMIRLIRMLSEGAPVRRADAERAAAELGADPEIAAQVLDTWPEHDDAGDILGLALTHRPTAHQFTLGGREMFLWCALDAAVVSIIVDQPADVVSSPPDGGEPVLVHVSPDGFAGPPDTVLTWRRVADEQVDFAARSIWATFCHHSFFFGDRGRAEAWAADREDIVVGSLREGFQAARAVAGALLRYES